MSTNIAVSEPRSGTRRYRPEIEGLRAVAAILVVVFHVFVGRVSGGVDVFFAVAGFLITLILLEQAERSGALDAARYFARLMTRLLPLALVVLTVVAVVVMAMAPVWYQPVWLAQVGWSALYAENWALARASVEYLGAGALASPVQHFWAMSMQGQFYVLWFVLVLGGLGAARLLPGARVRGVVGAGMLVLFAASFGTSVWLTATSPALSYFHTGTRVWEFAAGGLLALGITRLPSLGTVAGRVLGWGGLALILSGGLLIGEPTNFPGYAALWPVAGAIMVILAGEATGAGDRGSATRLLGSAPLVAIGGMSYALYLWHWPILTFTRMLTMQAHVDLLPGLAIIAVSFALAYASTRLVEGPARRWLTSNLTSGLILRLGLSVVGLLALVVFALAQMSSTALRVLVGEDRTASVANLASAREDFPQVYLDGCVQQLGRSSVITCEHGDPDADVTVMLTGGSHAAHWFPALEALADQRHWRLVTATKDACRFTARADEQTLGGDSCGVWNQALLRQILDDPPDMIVTTATVSDGGGEGAERMPDGYLEQWRALGRAGVQVVAIRDTPRWYRDPVDCLWAHDDDPQSCAVERGYSLSVDSPIDALVDPPANVSFVDVNDLICSDDTCPAAIGGLAVYWDLSHLTATFARSLAPALGDRIPSIG